MFLEECKYVFKENKIPEYIIDDIEISSDCYGEDFDEDIFNKENPDKENFDEEN